jgi:hypothetical protein
MAGYEAAADHNWNGNSQANSRIWRSALFDGRSGGDEIPNQHIMDRATPEGWQRLSATDPTRRPVEVLEIDRS